MSIDLDDLKSGCKLGVTVGTAALALLMLAAWTGLTPRAWLAPDLPKAELLRVSSTKRVAEFGAVTPSQDLRWVADWIADTRDNGSSAFILVDKRSAQMHVFDADARLLASSAVLVGAALGDESVPGIGSRAMSSILASERTTPAGRFVGERGINATGEDVVWVDYDAAVSMHRVRLNNPLEHRAERLASPSADDNRISYGCINVPAAFYDRYVQTVFAHQHANVYVLPDVKSVQQVFNLSIADPRSRIALQH